GSLEHVVHPTHVGDVAVVVDGTDVTGVVVAARERLLGTLVVTLVARHEPHGTGREIQTDLPLPSGPARDRVEQGDGETGESAPHGPGFDGQSRGVRDLHTALRLTEPVADRHYP